AEAKGDVRGAPDFGAGSVDRKRQALAAEIFGAGDGVPAGVGPALVGVRPAGGGGHLAGIELDAMLIAAAGGRGQHVGGELAGFLQHRGGDVAVEIAVMASLNRGLQPRAVVERKQNVLDRCLVGHDRTLVSSLPDTVPSSHETGVISTAREAAG